MSEVLFDDFILIIVWQSLFEIFDWNVVYKVKKYLKKWKIKTHQNESFVIQMNFVD